MESGATITLGAAIGLGAIVSSLAARVGIPAVLPLLLAGVGVGASGLGLVNVATLDSEGQTLRALVALSIGLLVFEGGLHLDRSELARAPRAVLGLLTIGSLMTWGAVAALAHYLLEYPWPVATLLGALLIVTGPTVVQPILRLVRLSPNLHAVLSAEAILIDPIGVVVSVLTLEMVLAYYTGGFEGAWPSVIRGVGLSIGAGIVIGIAAGFLGALVLRIIATRARAGSGSPGPLNVGAVGVCMLTFAAGEMVAPEGGLVAATIAAVILSNTHAIASSDVRQFKEQVSTLLVGMLFILLASQLDVARLSNFGWRHVVFIAGLIFVVRPLNVIAGAGASRLAPGERAFAGLFAPRGIVAASIAALAASQLSKGLAAGSENDSADPRLTAQIAELDVIVFAVIAASVAWATIAAWPLGRLLGVLRGPPRGVMIVGAHRLGRDAARALQSAGVPVVLVDSNTRKCDLAARDGLPVAQGDATDTEQMTDLAREREIGWVFSWTGNDDIDKVVGRWCERTLGAERSRSGLPALPAEVAAAPANGGGAAQPIAPSIRAFERLLHEGRLAVSLGAPDDRSVCLLSVREGAPVSLRPPSGGSGEGGAGGGGGGNGGNVVGKSSACLVIRPAEGRADAEPPDLADL
ncbi:MAG: cation:proton antiporter [Phycisphaerales bacterium]